MDTQSKLCKVCKSVLPLDQFGKNGKKKDGQIRYKSKCLQCLQDYERKKFQDKILKIVGGKDKIKCSSCGYDKCFSAIEFHHVDPSTKDHLVSGMKNYSEAKLRAEIEKCVMLCCMCHREHHAGVRVLPIDITG